MSSPAAPAPPRGPLSTTIPPLILGTGTFNTQYVPSPSQMPYTNIVSRALTLGIRAFDTSPYYGPSEILLGAALASCRPERQSIFLITKAGRVGPNKFDYTAEGVRASVEESLRRLGVGYLDLVYCHDVEFVSPGDVLEAVAELRKMREEGLIRYVGISGYPLEVLTSLAKLVLKETREPLDAVLSYSHFTLQNTTLGSTAVLQAFKEAKVDVVLNASILGMGLLTTRGVDAAPMAAWHPAPPELRTKCTDLKKFAEEEGMRLEDVAIRWSLDTWAATAKSFGTKAHGGEKMGVSVAGVSSVGELEETWRAWRDVTGQGEGGGEEKTEVARRVVEGRMWPALGEWKDYGWESPGKDYVPSGPSRPAPKL